MTSHLVQPRPNSSMCYYLMFFWCGYLKIIFSFYISIQFAIPLDLWLLSRWRLPGLPKKVYFVKVITVILQRTLTKNYKVLARCPKGVLQTCIENRRSHTICDFLWWSATLVVYSATTLYSLEAVLFPIPSIPAVDAAIKTHWIFASKRLFLHKGVFSIHAWPCCWHKLQTATDPFHQQGWEAGEEDDHQDQDCWWSHGCWGTERGQGNVDRCLAIVLWSQNCMQIIVIFWLIK